MSASITFVTTNKNKVALFQKHAEPFGLAVTQADIALDEPQADSVEAVVLSKATQAFQLLGVCLVVEDTGFSIDELRGFPGPFTRYALETIGVRGILTLAQTLASRSCGFINAMVYVDASGEKQTFVDASGRGRLAYEIDQSSREDVMSMLGQIFIPDGAQATLNGLSADERNKIWQAWAATSVYTQCAQWIASQRT